MPAVAPVLPKNSANISAAKFYAEQGTSFRGIIKKKQNRTVTGIKKLFTSNKSQAVTDSIKKYAQQAVTNSVVKKKAISYSNGEKSCIEQAVNNSVVKKKAISYSNGEKPCIEQAVNNSIMKKKAISYSNGEKPCIEQAVNNSVVKKKKISDSNGNVTSCIITAKIPELAKPDQNKTVNVILPVQQVVCNVGKQYKTKNLERRKGKGILNKNEPSTNNVNTEKQTVVLKKKKYDAIYEQTVANAHKLIPVNILEDSGIIVKSEKVKKIAPQLPVRDEKLDMSKSVCCKATLKVSKKKISISSKSEPIGRLLHSLDGIEDTKLRGLRVMSYFLAPYDVSEFFNSYWEKKHLLLKRKNSQYMDGLFSTKVFDNILREEYVEFGKNLDITSYTDGVRETHNPVGRAYPPVVWDYFSNGCSLRLLNPQTFHKPVWRLLAALQEYMGSFCGANIYLTPAETQGFAPHWDDIEAFIIQLEGKKRWRVYKPRKESEVLPRHSSANLLQNEIGAPIIDVILEKGDLLYFPRGYIHQAEAVADTHSLHITISSYQKNSWIDLFEKMFSSETLAQVAATSVVLREGLPRGCLEYMGTMVGESTSDSVTKKKRSTGNLTNNATSSTIVNKKRKLFKEKVLSLIVESVLSDSTIDRAVDAIARQFVRVALPPPLTNLERLRTVAGDGERWGLKGVEGRVEMDPTTRVRLLGSLSIRVALCSDEWRVYHSIINSREYEGREEQYIVVDEAHLPAVRCLINAYPRYTVVEDLPLPVMEDKMTLAMALWEQQLLITELPLEETMDDCCISEEEDRRESGPF